MNLKRLKAGVLITSAAALFLSISAFADSTYVCPNGIGNNEPMSFVIYRSNNRMDFTVAGQTQTGVAVRNHVYGNFSNPQSENNPNGGYLWADMRVKRVHGIWTISTGYDSEDTYQGKCFKQ